MVYRGLALMVILWGGSSCGNTSRTIIYNEHNYEQVSTRTHIRVRGIDGRTLQFYRMEIASTDDKYVYARCWRFKQSDPVDYKFDKSEIIIESTEFSVSRTGEYILVIVLTVGLILIAERIFRG